MLPYYQRRYLLNFLLCYLFCSVLWLSITFACLLYTVYSTMENVWVPKLWIEETRRYRDRYRCQSRRGRARNLDFRDPPTPRTSPRSLFADRDPPPSQQSPPSQQQQYCSLGLDSGPRFSDLSFHQQPCLHLAFTSFSNWSFRNSLPSSFSFPQSSIKYEYVHCDLDITPGANFTLLHTVSSTMPSFVIKTKSFR
jgi:hypothetical protein